MTMGSQQLGVVALTFSPQQHGGNVRTAGTVKSTVGSIVDLP